MTAKTTVHDGSSPPGISVIMPVYNGADFIVRSLPPLVAMKRRGEVEEVIVVDDSSTDASAQIASSLGARVMPSGGRLGPAAARNLAARSSSGEILWFVDGDVVVHDDAVAHLCRSFKPPGVVAVFGAYDDRPAAQNFLSQYKNLVHHYYHNQGHREASTFWAGCGAIRRGAFFEVGGFDPEKFTRPSVEDIELGFRLLSAGGRIRLVPEMKSTHLKAWHPVELIRTEVFSRAIPWSRLMLEETGVVNDLNVSRPERLRAALAGIGFLCAMSATAGWAPWWSVIPMIGVLVWANRGLVKLFYRRRGVWFAARALAFHQLYYLYSSAAFAYCWLESRVKHPRQRTRS